MMLTLLPPLAIAGECATCGKVVEPGTSDRLYAVFVLIPDEAYGAPRLAITPTLLCEDHVPFDFLVPYQGKWAAYQDDIEAMADDVQARIRTLPEG